MKRLLKRLLAAIGIIKPVDYRFMGYDDNGKAKWEPVY